MLIGAYGDDTKDANVGQAHVFTLLKDPFPEGDFIGDGIADGRDFLAWQRGNSPNPLSPSDLVEWQASYGAGGSLENLATIP